MSDDRTRFESLWQSHYRPVLAYALRRVSPDVAADVASETFLTAWRRIDERPESPRLWLYGIARGIAANQLRWSVTSTRCGFGPLALRVRTSRPSGTRVEELSPCTVRELSASGTSVAMRDSQLSAGSRFATETKMKELYARGHALQAGVTARPRALEHIGPL